MKEKAAAIYAVDNDNDDYDLSLRAGGDSYLALDRGMLSSSASGGVLSCGGSGTGSILDAKKWGKSKGKGIGVFLKVYCLFIFIEKSKIDSKLTAPGRTEPVMTMRTEITTADPIVEELPDILSIHQGLRISLLVEH
eukprot:jgi/Bigna1/146367/aug1.113_g21075